MSRRSKFPLSRAKILNGTCLVNEVRVENSYGAVWTWPSEFYLGFIVWGRSPEFPRRVWGHAPRKFFERNMHWDAIWCILRNNFEKCSRVCTDLIASGWFFRYSYLYTVMITIYFGGKLGIFFWVGGSRYPSNTLDKNLTLIADSAFLRPNYGSKIENVVLYMWVFRFPFVQNIVRIKQ